MDPSTFKTAELAVETASLLVRAQRSGWGKSVRLNYFRLKRFVCTGSRERAELALVHDAVNHKLKEYLAGSLAAGEMFPDPVDQQSFRTKINRDFFNGVCSALSDHFNWQVPGGCCVCIKAISRAGKVLTSPTYAHYLQTFCGGDQSRVDELLKRRIAPGSKELMVVTRARCHRTPAKRAERLPFSFKNHWSAFSDFRVSEKHSPPVHCPNRDLHPDARSNERYINPNPEYWRDYRATAKIPIWLRRPGHTDTGVVISEQLGGFLCLDSLTPFAFRGMFDFDDQKPRSEWSPGLNLATAIADAVGLGLIWGREFGDREKAASQGPAPGAGAR